MMAWSEDTPTLAETSGLAESVRAQLALLEPDEPEEAEGGGSMRLRRSRQAVSSTDLRALRWARRRALGLRIVLAGGAVALLLRQPPPRATSTCASGASCRPARRASS